jgi:hypothetical protein
LRPDHRWATRRSKRFERVAADVRLGDELTKQPKPKGTLRRGAHNGDVGWRLIHQTRDAGDNQRDPAQSVLIRALVLPVFGPHVKL